MTRKKAPDLAELAGQYSLEVMKVLIRITRDPLASPAAKKSAQTSLNRYLPTLRAAIAAEKDRRLKSKKAGTAKTKAKGGK
jgi:hypothetical protein